VAAFAAISLITLSAIIIDATRHYFRYFHFDIITLPRHCHDAADAFPPLFSLYFVSLILPLFLRFISPLLTIFYFIIAIIFAIISLIFAIIFIH
jgi:hypothetical protein